MVRFFPKYAILATTDKQGAYTEALYNKGIKNACLYSENSWKKIISVSY